MVFYSAETLKCTGCSEIYHFPVRDHFFYSEGDLDMNPENVYSSPAFHRVLRVRAWCIDCNRPTLAERIPSTREFMNAAALARLPPGTHDIDDELIYMEAGERRFLFEKLTSRASRGRCLACGSKDWLRLDIVNGKLQPPLIHEGCNSPFEWHGHVAGIIGRIAVRAYSFEGELLAEGEAVA